MGDLGPLVEQELLRPGPAVSEVPEAPPLSPPVDDELVEKLMKMFKNLSDEDLLNKSGGNKTTRVAALVESARRGRASLAKLIEKMGLKKTEETMAAAARFGTSVRMGLAELSEKARGGLVAAGGAIAAFASRFPKERIVGWFAPLGLALMTHGGHTYVLDTRYKYRGDDLRMIQRKIQNSTGKSVPIAAIKEQIEKIQEKLRSHRYGNARYKAAKNSIVANTILETAKSMKLSLKPEQIARLESMVARITSQRRYGNARYKTTEYNSVVTTIVQMAKDVNLSLTPEQRTRLTNMVARITSQRRYGQGRYLKPTSRWWNRKSEPPTINSRSNVNMDTALQAEITKAIANMKANNVTRDILVANSARARAILNRIKTMTSTRAKLAEIHGRTMFSEQTSLPELLIIRQRNSSRPVPQLDSELNAIISAKVKRTAYSLDSNFNASRVSNIARAIRNNRERTFPGRAEFLNGVRRAIERVGERGDYRTAANRLKKIANVTSGLNIRNSISNAQRRIERLRQEEIRRRQENGRSYGNMGLRRNRNRGSAVYPEYGRPQTYGNVRPLFAPEPNRPMPGVAGPAKLPPMAYPSIPVPMNNNRSRQAAMPFPELPPMEETAVTNAGGPNKALNLVENAGGVTNVVKTANIMKQVGNNPNAAVAAGANAKNVRIVLQLGGANNALKVASAVPKLKKRRRAKKAPKKALPKPPRVKEIKKLIEYLGTKNNLVKRLPNKENKEKKLTKKQIVSKITRHLLRKN